MPEVETGHDVEPDVFLAPGGALQTAVDGLPPLVAHAAESAGPLGDVVFEQVDPRVGAVPQVGGGHVRHAGGLLVVVGDHVVHVRVGVGELLECLVFCSVARTRGKGRHAVGVTGLLECSGGHYCTCSEGVSIDDSRQEPAQSAHGEVADVTTQLLPDLLPLESTLRPWSHADI